MNIPAAPVLLTSVFCLAALDARAGRFLFSERQWGDCVVVTDMTEAGRALRPASPENPVYFLGEAYGGRLGSMHGDELPDPKEMSRFVAKVLAKQGYFGAKPGVHEPELFLALQWGRIDQRSGDLLWFLGYDRSQDTAAPEFPLSMMPGRGSVHGPEIFRIPFRPREIETVLEYSKEDIFGFIISAFEYKTAHTAEPIVLWQTRIALPANGKSMSDALTTIVQIAGPQIGRETTKPVLRGTQDRYTTKLGELEFIGFEEEEPK
jgi:hypothetical protein